MKPHLRLVALVLLIFGGITSSNAGQYAGADITLNGSDYSAIPAIPYPTECECYEWQCRWEILGSTAATWWANPPYHWIEYTADLSAGHWHIGLSAINLPAGDGAGLGDDPTWYPQFEVLNSLTGETINVPASDTQVNYGYTNFTAASAGSYTVRFVWLNDKTDVGKDANLRIVNVFFDRYEQYSSVGFDPPMDKIVKVKKSRVLPLNAALTEEDGTPVTNVQIGAAPPVIQVMFQSGVSQAVDVTADALPAGLGTEGNCFVYADGKWHYNLATKPYTAPGTYTVTMVSGDATQYVIDPTCVATFVIE